MGAVNEVSQRALESVDVCIVQKQTSWERYTKLHAKAEFYDYVKRSKDVLAPVQAAHADHLQSRDLLFRTLERLGLSYAALHLDDLRKNKISFFDENKERSGLRPKFKLVISLGGDGTFLHASHHVGGEVALLGINSSVANSVGHLCSVKPQEIESALRAILDKKHIVKKSRRLKVRVLRAGKSTPLPLALNDVLFCHKHPAASSRYEISVLGRTGTQAEKHISSGVWVSTAQGRSAAIAAYGFESIPNEPTHMYVAARELYRPATESLKLGRFFIDGEKEFLSIFSRMRQGLVCVDGPDFCAPFGFGDRVEISLPEHAVLSLIAQKG